MWPSYGLFLTLYGEMFRMAILRDISRVIHKTVSCDQHRDISHVIQKNVSWGQLTGYFSRYTEECFVWPSYGIFLTLYRIMFHVASLRDFFTLYRRMFHVANLRDISHVIQNNVSCGQLTGYFSRYTEECFMWPTYGIFLRLYRIMFHVANVRDISHVIHKNVSCCQLTGYFSR